MLDYILISVRRAAAHLLDDSEKVRLSSLSIGQFIGAEWEAPSRPTNWRNEMTELLDQLESKDVGLLILVDEVQPKLSEMIELAAAYQLLIMDNRRVALLMAGLPHNMLALETDKTVSFLRRAQKCHLGRTAQRLGKTHSYATQYKNRLLGQGVIEEAPDGIRFQLPLMRAYVEEANAQ